ncbi:hypothetical protein [Caenimonas koreensis]|uniref:hypothetical protein n=1 Tax=Caenimonas koreensis TaxID=367474 RepID=UPI003784CAB2
MLPIAISMISTVLLLVFLGFFVLSSTPLLVLKHDVPMDSRVVRQVFHYCYRLVTVAGVGAAIGYSWSGRFALAISVGCIAGLALFMHEWLLTRMDALRVTMHDNGGDSAQISRFRKLHVGAIALNVTQLVALGVALRQLNL